MKTLDFFQRAQREKLYRKVYRDVLKTSQEMSSDPIVRGHVRIKARYLIRQVKHTHDLAKILDNYRVVNEFLTALKQN